MSGLINKDKCGCQRGRSTTDHLVRIETEIRLASVLNEHFVSAFYDLEKAYDTTWRYRIFRDLADAGLLRQYQIHMATCSPIEISHHHLLSGHVAS